MARRQYQLRDCVWYPITLEQLAIRALPRRKRDCRRGLPGRQNRRQDCIARDTSLHRVSTAAEFPPADLACKDRDEPNCGWGDDDRVTEMKDSGSCRKGHVLQPIRLQALHAVRIEEPRARTRLFVQTRAYGSLLSLFAYGHPNQGSRRVGGRQSGGSVRQRLYPPTTVIGHLRPPACKQPLRSCGAGLALLYKSAWLHAARTVWRLRTRARDWVRIVLFQSR